MEFDFNFYLHDRAVKIDIKMIVVHSTIRFNNYYSHVTCNSRCFSSIVALSSSNLILCGF